MIRSTLTRVPWRQFHTSIKCLDTCKKHGQEAATPALRRIRELQKQFQIDNGLPVFLKMGARDQFLYRLTMVLAFIGLCSDIKFYLSCM